jgi:hypothetical protein
VRVTAPRRLTPAELAACWRWDPDRRRVPVETISAEELLSRLEGVRRNGEGRWMARCPSHGDKAPSLSIREGDEGRVLLHCFSGCEFTAIVAALGLTPQQLFPPSAEPWRPRRPRPDPERETREGLERLARLHVPPAPERMRKELRFIGHLLLGGTRALAEVPATFDAASIKAFSLRLVFLAMRELAGQGTPRRWFSPLVLARGIDRHGGDGHARRLGVFTLSRLAVAEARRGGDGR